MRKLYKGLLIEDTKGKKNTEIFGQSGTFLR